MSRYRSHAEATKVRLKAIECAARLMANEEPDQERLWAYCVFFESYVAHGSAWTKKNMLTGEPAKVIRLVK